jgi:hypothetical protein
VAEEAREEAATLRGERGVLQSQVSDLRAERDRLAGELAEARRPWVVRVIETLRRKPGV